MVFLILAASTAHAYYMIVRKIKPYLYIHAGNYDYN